MKKLLALILGLALTAIPFTASATVFPIGHAKSGDLTVSTSVSEDSVKSGITVLSSSGIGSTTVASVSGFAAGDYVMLAQMTGTGAGNYEIQKIRAISGVSLFFYGTLTNTYQATNAQVVKIFEYHNVTVTASGSWTASAWNGTTGGILAALITGTFTQSAASASTTVLGKGGGGGSGGSNPPGSTPSGGTGSGAGGGSGTSASGSGTCGGGGGGHVSSGGGGSTAALCIGPAGSGGGSYGTATLQTMQMGSGGGGGYGINATGQSGGSGGGIIFFTATNFSISNGLITARANDGGGGGGDGGAGSGGSIRLLPVKSLDLGASIVVSGAGSGGSLGGSGSQGRIATVSAASVTGTASPTIDTSSTDRVYDLDNDAHPLIMGMSF